MTYNENADNMPLAPRSFQPVANIFCKAYETMLKAHPEAFDCIIYPAKSSEYNEILADNEPVATLLDRDERIQEYEQPIAGRALIAPSQELRFGASDSGIMESFHSASEAITLLLSESGLRKHSLIQWREYAFSNGDETVDRLVYVAEVRPLGRNLNAQMTYICYPLPAAGEKPEIGNNEAAETDRDNASDNALNNENNAIIGII